MRTSVVAIVGGTASALGGGKFSNGAMSGAFTHMFNHEMGEAMKTKIEMEKQGRKDLMIAHGKGKKGYHVKDSRGFIYPSDTPKSRQMLKSLEIGLSIPLAGGIVAGGVTTLFAYPFETMMGIGFVESAYLGGQAPTNLSEGAGFIANFFGITEAVK